MHSGVGVGGVFTLEYVRPDGTPGWRVQLRNAFTTRGLNYMLEAGFRFGSLVTAATLRNWFSGLIDDTNFAGVSPNDTLASHSGWAEFRQVYQQRPGVASRAIQIFGPANGGMIDSAQPEVVNVGSNSNPVYIPNRSGHIQIVGDGVIRGTYLANGEFIGSGSVLACTAILPPTQDGLPVEAGGSVRISYILIARDAPVPVEVSVDGNGVVTYPSSIEVLAATGGDLITTGEERAGVHYYRTTVGARSWFAAGVADVFVLYTGITQALDDTTIYDLVNYTTTVGVRDHKRTLIDGRADLIATGRYRR